MRTDRQRVTKRIEFDAGHRLMLHESRCAHVHGHRFAAEFTCEGGLDQVGRVIDFGTIKAVIGKWIDENLDHAFIVQRADPFRTWLEMNQQRHYVLDAPPSAENIAALLFRIAGEALFTVGGNLVSVRVYETPSSWADYKPVK